jgi:hypothetical protein
VIQPVKELYSRSVAAAFGPPQFKAIRQRLVGEGLSRTYINEFMRRVVAMFQWGAAEGKTPAAVPHALAMIPGLHRGKSEAGETDPVRPIEDAIVDATLPTCRLSWRIWCASSGLPGLALPRSAS